MNDEIIRPLPETAEETHVAEKIYVAEEIHVEDEPASGLNKFFLIKDLIVDNKVLLTIIGIAAMAIYIWLAQGSQPMSSVQYIEQKLQPSSLEADGMSSVQIEPTLSSDIPAYFVAAVRQELQATPLRKADLIATSDDEEYGPEESVGVVDKVVVAPKVLTPQVKPAPSVVKHAVAQGRYTIQLLASHHVEQLNRFAQAHHLTGNSKVRHFQRQDGVWYVLTVGEYAAREEAKHAVSRLPKDVVQLKPWVRSIAELHG